MAAKKTTKKPTPKPKIEKEKEPPVNSRIRKEITRLNKIFVAK
jgi:hypothetical protein